MDKRFLKQTLREWGILAPVIFIALQALQVIIAPIPGEVTGILGGFLFGEWLGLLSRNYLPCFTSCLTETRFVTEFVTQEGQEADQVSPG